MNITISQPASFAFCLALTFALIGCADASAGDHAPIIPGYQRFAEVEEFTPAQHGMLLLNELNCMSCHQGEPGWSIAPKQSPILTGVGDRVLPEYFARFISDPHVVKPGTTMPNVLAGKSEAERNEIAESIGHFLASTGKPNKLGVSADAIQMGETLFHTIGCVACHDPQNEDVHIETSIPLGDLTSKYTAPGLVSFLQNPLHVRPSGRMPQFNLAPGEAQRIAAYLLRDAVVASKTNFAYYEGDWERLPDFDQLEPKSTGISNGFELLLGDKKDGYGIVYTGYWKTTKNGKYKFRLGCEDGSRLIIDGQTIVTNDNLHGLEFQEANDVSIVAGLHEVRVEFFEGSGGEALQVEVYGDGLDGVGLQTLLQSGKEPAIKEEGFVVDKVKAAAGKMHFQVLGCAKCHEMKVDEVKLESTAAAAKPISELDLQSGCLSGDQPQVQFGLTEHQVKCLTAAINKVKSNQPSGRKPLHQVIHEKLLTLNCYACHNRETKDSILGGVVDLTGDSFEVFGRKDWFTGTQVEMGDEGQHPPALKSAGAKLNPEWLGKVLNEGIKSRPYMHTRMPMFGGKKVFGELVDELITIDKLTDPIEVTQTESESKLKAHGRFLAGEEALSCIKCHSFGKFKATGIQAIDLTTMTQRLSKDWFQVYMLKPSKFRRGTRMPESWPGGKSFYPDMLDGSAQKQIDALWTFLADGEKAPKPKGLVRTKLEIKAVDRPMIYRNFIEGAGARAIGVGYPQQVNLAFDGQNCRMAILWQENFIDASRHWTARGQGFEAPLGENILQLHDGVVFTTEPVSENWPTEFSDEQRPRFKGYRFDKIRQPIFDYVIDGVTIADHPLPVVVDDRSLIKRIFQFKSANAKTISYLAAVGDEIKINDSSIIVDQNYKTKLTNVKEIKLIKLGDKQAAAAIIDLSSGSAEVEQSYRW